ncbi:Cof-type HAD-IIB family hydrolase [Paenibacillus sp. PsM32]|uniref:Cof-type HAD-IIB family hydrolase n=1 Tax=Paenibacillus kyungheensis TaxID=1452732 RepID=A0AAX3M579_9BACL|nr:MULTISPECIES: Cof-type HAD-IIB family hydrolase [Paenibacillus]MDN4617117.1 Cof-type HAD-IIB family hydrolase [Paenibacillus sp. PsM32]WCT57052.1 Cof-type HAD-IIB family hydrolase [Paenibacillus kyungheensis]WDF49852.1 Cof-type HAD-IIB family hydrolase [Paenibacillus sp. KACC 21273]
MTVKLIAIDLDGTLLSAHTHVSETNIQAIRTAQQEGILVTIATGREHGNVREILQASGLQTPVISSNGSVIHDEQKKQLFALPLDRQAANEVLQWLESNEYYYQVHSDRGIYTVNNSHQLLAMEVDRLLSTDPDPSLLKMLEAMQFHHENAGFLRISSFTEIPDQADLYNVMALSLDSEKLQIGRDKFSNRDDMTMVISGSHNFEMEHKQASKGFALQRLAEHFNIAIEDTMAIGDNYNDVSMLQIAGKGVAMGNADLEVQSYADEVTKNNEEDGVAHAIYKAMGMTIPSV